MIHKITTGFVVQRFTDEGNFVDQEFVAGNPVELETEDGHPILDNTTLTIAEGCYQPFNMRQDQ